MSATRKYVSECADLLAEWDWAQNDTLGKYPQKTSCGSDKKVHWVCSLGHKWEATPGNRIRGQGCPVCSGKKVLIGFNDFSSQHPSKASEWHTKLNDGLLPSAVTSGSNKRVWWQCTTCGTEWQTSVANRVRGTGCPNCGRIKQGRVKEQNIIATHGSFADAYPELVVEWDCEKNTLLPSEVTKQSHRRIWWKCKVCSYSWATTVYHRTVRGSGCPACSNKAVVHSNCLSTTHPELLEKWNYRKNISISPEEVTAGSHKKVWWVCDKGHEWESTVNKIASGGVCPFCCGQRVLPRYNDLATTNPELAQEWHPTKNGELLPTQFTSGSSRLKIWWLCSRGHEYQARIANRTQGTGCPICDKERKTSFPEQVIFYYLGKLTKAENRYLYDGKTEIDIYLPELSVGIEYDGYLYHYGSEARAKEQKKDNLLRAKGIRIIRVKEVQDLSEFEDRDDIIYCRNYNGYSYLKDVIIRIIARIGIVPAESYFTNIDVSRDSAEILSKYLQYEKENSLAEKNPQIAAEWHPTRNGYVTPNMVSYASGKKVWWLGKCGHEWQMSIDSRNKGTGCPICSGNQILPGFNDLQTTHPELVLEWDYLKNQTIHPTQISYGSKKKVWWLCDNGHSYQATPGNRSWGRGCPICGQEKRAQTKHLNHVQSHDCLNITHPDLVLEWDYSQNADMHPNTVTLGSDYKTWWICPHGHNYQATVANRVAGKGCPICSGNKIIQGINDLATVNPALVEEWDYSQNKDNPHTISPNSHKKAWWICKTCGNSWQAEIHSRNSGVACPLCARQRTKQGQRSKAIQKSGSLKDRNPVLSEQWHPTKNGDMTPYDISPGSDYKVWWICQQCGNEWCASVGSRNRGHGCPRCSKKRK